ncbi:hypothetical protein NG799_28710 [Laspinema sp. D1]|uniref:Single-stranded DNA-binding protein n=1 Tax=Laspinema palackyanum D2a TaxID=2953684 RepID=A0ABT2MZY8_9CYAN|nr:hypothetical protein [Laspinema sp. D2a]
MNIFSFKLRLDSIQVGHTADGNIQVMGFSSFQFFDGKQTQIYPLAFTAYGESAQTIAQAGINGVVVAIGELNIFSVDRQTHKDKVPNFHVEESQILRQGNSVSVEVSPPTIQSTTAPTTQPRVAHAQAASHRQPQPKQQPVGVATAPSNGHSPVDDEELIPF